MTKKDKRLFSFQDIFIGLLFLVFSISYCQESTKIDSLKRLIEKYKSNQKNTLVDSSKVILFNQLSEAYIESNPIEASKFAMEALALSNKIHYKNGSLMSFSIIGRINNNTGDFTIAIENINKVLAQKETIKNKTFLGDNHFYLAQSYLFLNNFPEALKNLNTALQLFEKLNDKLRIARIYNNIAILYGKQDRYDKELSYYNLALATIKNENSKKANRLKDIINSNIALIYNDKGEHDKALKILLNSYINRDKNSNPNNYALICRSLGSTYLSLKNYDKAIEFFEKSLKIYSETGNKSGLGDVYRELGKVYFQKKNNQKAIELTEKGLSFSSQIGELESIKFGHENLAKIYSQSGNYKKAFENQLLYKRYSDSMFNGEINNKMNQLQMNFEFERKQEMLQLEQKQKDEKQVNEAKKQKILFSIIALSLFFVSILAVGIYVNLKQHQKQKRIVEKQKEVIQNSLTEKETLLREIHHRVKNNLQIISSLLNMQSHDIDDEKILATIQEGQSRVQAMSLIHQNLYQSEHVNKVDVENYLKELAAYLSKMYRGDSDEILVAINTKGLQFDFDTAIPLGLIVNELVSNAYKHAFKDSIKGNIWIEIQALNDVDYELKVSNNGNKLPLDFDIAKSKSLGLKLVTILSKQLRGSFKNESTNSKTVCVVVFKDLKAFQSLEV
ncbi:MAG: tetratricopeptide repeat protein [Flavobacterium sp.]|uniref:tetratricopeptide repeat-containing sensor histidine kinase n=1 Tax=Flavobacterium sp. TaxID=239 RepID=UPI0037A923D5